jgi:hypothetical protein
MGVAVDVAGRAVLQAASQHPVSSMLSQLCVEQFGFVHLLRCNFASVVALLSMGMQWRPF